ncbi:MAG: hypothetical protein U0414_35870 [Polyangiaceae bacterium]
MTDLEPTHRANNIENLEGLPADTRLAILEDLRRRHLAFTIERLTGSEARAILESNVRSAIDALLASKVEDVVSADGIAKAIDALASSPAVEKMWRPAVRMFVLLEVARLREDSAPIGQYVPDRARADVRDLLARPGIMPAKLIRQVAEHEASEAVMRDVLDKAITDFQANVNPFTSDWGLPGLLKKMGPLGIGLAKSLESVQHEFEKRIQPELKRFLQGAAKRALKRGAEVMIERSDEPSFVALRRELFAWALEQPTNEVLNLDEKVVELGEAAAYEISRHVVSSDATRKRRRATIDMLFSAHRKQTVAQAMAVYGISPVLDAAAIAGALIGPVVAWVKSPAGARFLDDAIGAFYDAEIARS